MFHMMEEAMTDVLYVVLEIFEVVDKGIHTNACIP